MTRAYQEIYLNKAQSVLGDAFDYAINTCGIAGNDFIKLFSASTASGRMENGEPATLAGMSGYWIGWAVAYYQWYSGRKYSEIFRVFSYDDLLQMYHPLHEADITKFVDVVDKRIREYYAETNLKRIRTAYGCTQAELAKKAAVSLRSVQMYEQRNKDINKASVETVYRLAKSLGCTVEDLIEK